MAAQKHRKITDTDVQTMMEMRCEGCTYKKIAEAMGCSESYALRLLKDKKQEIEEIQGEKKKAYQEIIRDTLAETSNDASEVIRRGVKALLLMFSDEEHLIGYKVTPAQVTTAVGTIIDKYTYIEKLGGSDDSNSESGVILMPEASEGEE